MTDETLRRVDLVLTELIDMVETARALPMSTSCVVPRERVLDLLDELREVLPPEMDEARAVIAHRDRVLHDAFEKATAARDRAVGEADAVLADARHRAEQLLAESDTEAQAVRQAATVEHGRLVASTTVHQAAARAAAALREDVERYQQQVSAEADQYDARVRADADRYAYDARVDAERYATKLTADAEDYAERTLDELAAVLNRSAQTAEQGRSALAQRRASAWAAEARADDRGDHPAVAGDLDTPISA